MDEPVTGRKEYLARCFALRCHDIRAGQRLECGEIPGGKKAVGYAGDATPSDGDVGIRFRIEIGQRLDREHLEAVAWISGIRHCVEFVGIRLAVSIEIVAAIVHAHGETEGGLNPVVDAVVVGIDEAERVEGTRLDRAEVGSGAEGAAETRLIDGCDSKQAWVGGRVRRRLADDNRAWKRRTAELPAVIRKRGEPGIERHGGRTDELTPEIRRARGEE